MGVVTWKNIAPSNPAGILSAANQAAKTMGEGFSGVGTALQGGVDKKVQSETDQFVADLMSLGTQEERDAMIAEAEGAWLNLDTINKTNYELGAPDREQAAYEKQLASKHYFDKLMQGIKHEDDLEILTNTPRKSSSSSSSTIGSDRTADEKKGIFNPTNKIFTELEEADEGILDSWTAFGSDYGSNAQQKVQTFNNKFLTTYGNDISEEDLNVAFNTGILRWEDDFDSDNDFYFELDGKTVGINDKNADEYLYEKLMDEKFNEQERINKKLGYEKRDPEDFRTHKAKVKGQYFDEFEKNNSKLKEVELENLFFNIWNANTDSINTGKFSDTSKGIELFKTITDAKDVTADMEWDGGWYTGPGSGYMEFIKKRDALRKSAKEALSK